MKYERFEVRETIIEFDNPKAKEVEIVIKAVAGANERIFKFQSVSTRKTNDVTLFGDGRKR